MILGAMILLIDNYDSFTWNLVHLIGGLGRKVEVRRNDALSAAEALDAGAEAIVLSPGPGTPAAAGVSIDLVRLAAERSAPVFGVCLGLQAIAEAFGGRVVRARAMRHGKLSPIRHDGTGLFKGVANDFLATRYHSLVADAARLPDCLKPSAVSADDGEIMALEHETLPIAGVQFHPESVATEAGALVVANFLARARALS
jgi:anthranilate synthase component 2